MTFERVTQPETVGSARRRIRLNLFDTSRIDDDERISRAPGRVIPSARRKHRVLRLVKTTSPADDDDVLMARVAAGEMGPLGELVRRHQARAIGVAAHRLRDRALAEDAVQSAFMDLFRARARYQAQGKFRSYLFLLVLNRVRMIERKQRALSVVTFAFLKTSERSLAWLESTMPTPADTLHTQEERARVARAIDALPATQRDVVLLRYLADLSLHEIALALEIPEGTVKSRLHTGLATLKPLLQEAP
jgi:RNA polymerase sigma factor (sigma-70 family)